ncbi:hypothetical protein CRM79_02890 [Pantoea agglomerans]|nr:hypothetical protein CRM79_02890 [Pantoea agglomerans]GME41232.1 hypothetical protein ACJ3_27530 [Pantoea sp. QMID3]GME57800.1 hypothetical protein ACJ4_27680 [Pantoea sp. QMID4]GME57909.1 hypothetical protein ACJ2_23930 [Pantoea sp. QMID2]
MGQFYSFLFYKVGEGELRKFSNSLGSEKQNAIQEAIRLRGVCQASIPDEKSMIQIPRLLKTEPYPNIREPF